MADLKEFVNRVLLPVQLSLGLFQIMKTTPLWAVIHCALSSLLNFFYFPWTDYKQLEGFKGQVFKKVISYTTTAGTKVKKKDTEKNKKKGKSEDPEKSEDVTSVMEEKQKDPEESQKEGESEKLEKATKEGKSKDRFIVEYLGKKFQLDRKDGNIMLMKDGPAYYITDKMWETVRDIEKVAKKSVFVKDHKELWEEVVTGDIMEFEEVLDSVILDNRVVVRLGNDYFLPVNLLMSENKLMTTLNFVGLFLKAQNHIHWLIPALLTFASAIMGFSTRLRLWIYRIINKILCRSVQLLYDRLPLATRRWIYSYYLVENLKPSSDLKSKIVRGNAVALVTAGAKVDSESFADCESIDGSVIVDGGAKAHLETTIDCESLVDQSNHQGNQHYFLTQGPKAQSEEIWPKTDPVLFKCDRIRVLVDKDAKARIERLTEPVIMTDKSNKCVLLPKGTNAQLEPSVEISAKGPFLFRCESKCDVKCNSHRYSVFIEWIFDIKYQICSLKAGRLPSQLDSFKPLDVYITTDHCDIHCSRENDKIRAFTLPTLDGESLIADDLDTSSVEVECNSCEAIKLLKLAFYMAKYKTTSLKSYDRKTKEVSVRRFVESINAYVSSSYPPLYRLIMDDVVVR